ncbi:MAG TPA: lipocalin-like domain-containing protein [Pyrinomonadaceae bacterium]
MYEEERTDGGGAAESRSAQSQLVGTWKLVLFQDRNSPTDPWQNDFGDPPLGYFMYDATGHASIQIMKTPPVQISSDGPTPEQALEIFNGYIAYFGTYEVDESQKLIVHHVEGGLNPNDINSNQPRPFELTGDKLIIGDQQTWIRILQRVG